MTPQPPAGQEPVSSGSSTNHPPRPPAALGPAGPQFAPPPPGGFGPPPGGFGPPPGGFGPPPPGFVPMFPPPPAPQRGPGVFYAILVACATALFVGSLVLNAILFVVVASQADAKANPNELETVEQPINAGNANEQVAVIRLDGEITDSSKRAFCTLLDKIEADARWRGLVIEVDSPGGGVTPSDEMYDRIVRLKHDREQGGSKFPVVVSMSSLAASGGYYVSMAADRIFAQQTTLTGSIGVIMSRLDLSEAAQKYGIKDGSIVADGATFKNAGSPTSTLTPEQEAYFKSVLDDAFATFKARVASGRPNMTTREIDAAANGKIYSAPQALQLKLIDKIGYLDDAIAEVGRLGGLARPSAVRVERKLSAIEQLFGANASSRVPPTGARVGIGGTSVSITPETVEAFTRPRLQYLWSGN